MASPAYLVPVGIISILASVLSFYTIFQHLRYYTSPREQKWVVRILAICPMYALAGYIMILFNEYKLLLIVMQGILQTYEAFTIYAFLCLCIEYLQGEKYIISALKNTEVGNASCWTMMCCFKGSKLDLSFVRFWKQSTLQFLVVKIVILVAKVASHLGLLGKEDICLGFFYDPYNYSYSLFNLSFYLDVLIYSSVWIIVT